MDQRILPVGHCHTRSKTDFSLPEEFNARGYFAGIYGPRVYPDMKAETVILKAYGMQPKYFKSLPLHQSQEIIEETPEYTVFKYFRTPDWDFRQDVLSFGTRVEVLEPERVRKERCSRKPAAAHSPNCRTGKANLVNENRPTSRIQIENP